MRGQRDGQRPAGDENEGRGDQQGCGAIPSAAYYLLATRLRALKQVRRGLHSRSDAAAFRLGAFSFLLRGALPYQFCSPLPDLLGGAFSLEFCDALPLSLCC